MKQAEFASRVEKTASAVNAAGVRLSDVGVEYRLLTERQTTIKGRIMGVFSAGPPAGCQFWALRNISLTVQQSEIVGIIGSNGSGKSTLLRVMAGILPPTEGHAEVLGSIRPLLDLGSTMNGNLTGRQNSRLYAALNRIPRDQAEEMIPKVMEFSELGAFFDVPVRMYSSGMVARLSFGLATQTRPDVLLIDEVLSVGDEHFQRKSYFRMMKLIEKGSLVVIVSHNLQFVEQTCTRAILVSGGAVTADGHPSEIVAKYKSSIARS